MTQCQFTFVDINSFMNQATNIFNSIYQQFQQTLPGFLEDYQVIPYLMPVEIQQGNNHFCGYAPTIYIIPITQASHQDLLSGETTTAISSEDITEFS